MAGLHPHDHHAQLGGDRPAQRHVADGLVVDLHLKAVDRVVGRDHLVRQREVALGQGADGQAGALNGPVPHLQQVGAKGLQVGVEESFHDGEEVVGSG